MSESKRDKILDAASHVLRARAALAASLAVFDDLMDEPDRSEDEAKDDGRQTTIPGTIEPRGVTTHPKPERSPPAVVVAGDKPVKGLRANSTPVKVLAVMNADTLYTADEIAKAIDVDVKKTRGAITQLVNAEKIVAPERGKYRRV